VPHEGELSAHQVTVKPTPKGITWHKICREFLKSFFLVALGMILGAAYSLWLYNRVIFGNLKPKFLQNFSIFFLFFPTIHHVSRGKRKQMLVGIMFFKMPTGIIYCKATLQLHYKKPCTFLRSIKLHNNLDCIIGIQSNNMYITNLPSLCMSAFTTP
jgi:hypothetical protein